jgi:hypothetical protein
MLTITTASQHRQTISSQYHQHLPRKMGHRPISFGKRREILSSWNLQQFRTMYLAQPLWFLGQFQQGTKLLAVFGHGLTHITDMITQIEGMIRTFTATPVTSGDRAMHSRWQRPVGD